MTSDIALILAMDGLATGAIYVLVGLGLVLIFSTTRVIFVPFGDIVAFSGLTLASLQLGRVPGTLKLVVVLAITACAVEAWHHWRHQSTAKNCARHLRLWRAAIDPGRDCVAASPA